MGEHRDRRHRRQLTSSSTSLSPALSSSASNTPGMSAVNEISAVEPASTSCFRSYPWRWTSSATSLVTRSTTAEPAGMVLRCKPPCTAPPATVTSTTMASAVDELDELDVFDELLDPELVDELLGELVVVPPLSLEQASTPTESAIATTATRRADMDLRMRVRSFCRSVRISARNRTAARETTRSSVGANCVGIDRQRAARSRAWCDASWLRGAAM